MRVVELTDEKRAIFTPLLERARAGSKNALAEAVQLIEEPLRRWFRSHIPNQMRAKFDSTDLMQMTYIDAIKAFEHFEGKTVDDFVFWLMGIAMHNVHDLHRYHRRGCRCVQCERLLERAKAGELIDRRAEMAQIGKRRHRRLRWLRKAMYRLTRAERAVLRARYWERLTYRKMAERFGRSPEALRKVCGRLIKNSAASGHAERVATAGGRTDNFAKLSSHHQESLPTPCNQPSPASHAACNFSHKQGVTDVP